MPNNEGIAGLGHRVDGAMSPDPARKNANDTKLGRYQQACLTLFNHTSRTPGSDLVGVMDNALQEVKKLLEEDGFG